MIPLEALRLPEHLVQKIRDAGYNSVWDLHASNKYALRIRSRLSITAEDVDQIIAAMRAIGRDFKVPCEDPVGTEECPSAVALRELFARLGLHPRTVKHLKYFLLGFCTPSDLLDRVEARDTETIIQLLGLMDPECFGGMP